MMPVIVICLILQKQLGLTFHTTPSQNELAGLAKLLDDAPYRFCAQVRATDFPGSSWDGLFPLQQPRLDEPLDRTVTNAAQPCGFIQADSFRIR